MTTLTAACVVGLTTSFAGVSALPATATAALCRGEAATIVGSGFNLTGTEGRDVMVTNGAQEVKGLGGDDLICVTGADQPLDSYRPVTLDAGPGDDVVDSTAARSWPVDGQLGTGGDRFEGGPAPDSIYTGARTGWPWVSQDADRDVVLTGDGDDSVTSGVAGQPNPDVVDLGSGDDGLSWISSGWVDGSSITGGGSDNQGDHIGLELQAGANTLDTALPDGTGELRKGAVMVARWSGMEQHYVHDRAATGPASVTLTGGAANDRVSVSGAVALIADLGAGDDSLSLWRALPGDATVEADLGAGNDYLAVSQPPPAGSRLRAGAGRDSLTMGSDLLSLSWDLAGDGIHVGTDRAIEADSFEDATLMAPRVQLWGTRDDNTLAFVSCDATLRGRGGDDTLRMTSDYEFEYFKNCRDASVMVGGAGDDNFTSQGETRDRLVGGRGNDRFNAKGGNDILLGGPGRDIADAGSGRDRFQGGSGKDRVDGAQGRDTCSAERQQRCER